MTQSAIFIDLAKINVDIDNNDLYYSASISEQALPKLK
jgi:hypothetical protein